MIGSQQERDRRWMSHALALAAKAEVLGEVPVGAVVVCDEKIIGEGWNQPISLCDPTAHAEVMALRAAAATVRNYRLSAATLYVTIEPCTMCAGAIVHSRVARVVFAALEPKAGVLESNGHLFDQSHINHSIEYTGGICSDEAKRLMQAFFKRRRDEAKALKKLKRGGEGS